MARSDKPTKPYRLVRGVHSVPNPEANPEYAGDPEAMHKMAHEGDVVQLTDDQYKAFKDKFEPITSEGSDVKTADQKQFDDAKKVAASAKSGTTVNPNEPLAASATPPPQARPGVPTR